MASLPRGNPTPSIVDSMSYPPYVGTTSQVGPSITFWYNHIIIHALEGLMFSRGIYLWGKILSIVSLDRITYMLGKTLTSANNCYLTILI